jgi:hypothetical protein
VQQVHFAGWGYADTRFALNAQGQVTKQNIYLTPKTPNVQGAGLSLRHQIPLQVMLMMIY